MLVRYSSSIAVGAVVTAALIFWMQQMITSGDIGVRDPIEVRLPTPFYQVEPPPLRTTTRLPPIPTTPPVTRPTLEITNEPTTVPTTVRVGPVGPVTPPGPPNPLARPDGRPGPWIADSIVMLRSQIPPIYPIRALRRELEGYVIVEFTVTKRGAVRDVRIVESSHQEFEEAAATAVAKSRYQPQVVDSVPVDVEGLRTQIAFVIND